MALFFKICLFLLPWIIYPVKDAIEQFRLPKEIFFDFTCLGIIVIAFYNGMKFQYRNKWLAYFIGWGFLSIFINLYIPYGFAVKQQIFHIWTLFPSIHFILISIVTLIALSYFEESDYKGFAKVLCLSSIIIASFAMFQSIGLDPIAKKGLVKWYNHGHHFSAFLDNPNLVGNYLALCVPLFLLFKELRYKLGFVFIVIAVFLSRSEISIIAMGLSILVYTLLNAKRIFIKFGSLIISFLLGILICQHWLPNLLLSNFGGRLTIWKVAFTHLKENIAFGQGLGIFRSFDIKISNTLASFAHNDWLELTISLGVIGLILLILVLGNTIKKMNIANKTSVAYFGSFIAFLIIMCGSFPMENAAIGMIGLTSFWAIEKL